MASVSFIDSVVAAWNEAPPPQARSKVKRAPDDSKLVIEVETADHVATIEAWEQGSAVNVSVLDLKSQALTFLSSGKCKSPDEMKARLGQLKDLLKAT